MHQAGDHPAQKEARDGFFCDQAKEDHRQGRGDQDAQGSRCCGQAHCERRLVSFFFHQGHQQRAHGHGCGGRGSGDRGEHGGGGDARNRQPAPDPADPGEGGVEKHPRQPAALHQHRRENEKRDRDQDGRLQVVQNMLAQPGHGPAFRDQKRRGNAHQNKVNRDAKRQKQQNGNKTNRDHARFLMVVCLFGAFAGGDQKTQAFEDEQEVHDEGHRKGSVQDPEGCAQRCFPTVRPT